MARTKTPRTAWIDAGLVVLAEHGVDAVRVEALARTLGVTKGGFYGSFGGRDELLAAMLTTWERTVTEQVVARVEAAHSADPRDRLQRLIVAISERDPPAMRIDTEIAIRDWARRDPEVGEVVTRVDTIRGTYLREIFGGFCSEEEAEARTAIAMSVRLASQTMTFGSATASHEHVLHLIRQRLLA